MVSYKASIRGAAAVVPSSLQFCFEIVVKDTALEGAQLRIEEIPVTARCRECTREWTIDRPVFTCPHCQSAAVEVISGQELDIRSIEVTDEEMLPENFDSLSNLAEFIGKKNAAQPDTSAS